MFCSRYCLQGVALPIWFRIMSKFSNSSTKERIELIKYNIYLFGIQTINCSLADREFIAITSWRISI